MFVKQLNMSIDGCVNNVNINSMDANYGFEK